MSEPSTPFLSAGGLTLFGIATGLHPEWLVAGFLGCWWYNSYLPELPLIKRTTSSLLAALVAAWTTPPLVAWLSSMSWFPAPAIASVGFPVALAIGFLTHKVIGPQLLKLAERKAEDLAS